ncbi:MAG TPA: mechanosensitive ion channel family protein, partial [Desulfurivibrionaceae bacterium]|nr:mechanosensitive ion channel family protein [Desulfurivibrionaceae bacterium]
SIKLPNFPADWAQPTYKIGRFLVIAFTAVVVFPYLPGSDAPAFKGVSLFIGVLFSLGSTAAVANVVAGIILTYMRAFVIGDRVKIADTIGDIIEKTLLVTRVRTIKNEDITIPNAMVLGSHIINYSSSARERGLILHTTVTIGYDVPWRQVHELLLGAARASENILAEPPPFVLQTSLDDFYVSYQLNAYTDQPNRMALTYSALHQNIQDRFNAAGVEIMSPHYAALRDGNQVTVPEENLAKSYVAPAFRLTGLGAFLSGKGGER